MEELQELLELIEQLPEGLKADWEGTNHYELTSSKEGNFWRLCLGSYVAAMDYINCLTEDGEKIGLLMDIAEKAKAAEKILRKVVLVEKKSTDELLAKLAKEYENMLIVSL